MADPSNVVPTLDDKLSASDASIEKKGLDGAEVSEDAIMAKEVEEFEERLQRDEAADEEYLVQEAYEVAIKVRVLDRLRRCTPHTVVARSYPPAMIPSFRLSRSALYSLVSASQPSARECLLVVGIHTISTPPTVFWHKSTTSSPRHCLSHSCSFWSCHTGSAFPRPRSCRAVAFSVGLTPVPSTVSDLRASHTVPLTAFPVKEHVAIIIMSSSAAVSATAIQVISVQDCMYISIAHDDRSHTAF